MPEPILMPFQDLPFNGDTFVLKEFLNLKEAHKINVAVETGSCLFSTTKWLGENFEQVHTVEINAEYASHGFHKVADKSNVVCHIGKDSVEFIKNNLSFSNTDNVIFFLDAHWGNFCPLLDELQAIAEIHLSGRLPNPPVIAIHDFYTGNEELGYDAYNGKRFDFDFIHGCIVKLELAFGFTYSHYYNTEAGGAKRGLIYLFPNTKYITNELGTKTTSTAEVESL